MGPDSWARVGTFGAVVSRNVLIAERMSFDLCAQVSARGVGGAAARKQKRKTVPQSTKKVSQDFCGTV